MPEALVSVVTPFYNTEAYLAECIESVLAQSYAHFEYVLADNHSTDGSCRIAEEYARRDGRIRFFTFDEHLPQQANYNRALRLTSGEARYCKVVQADDLIMSHCLAEMVTLADADEDIVLVGAYALLQDHVFLDGLDYYESVLDGRDVGRRYLLGGPYILGSPTTCLYRMSEVKARPEFYNEHSSLDDAEVAMEMLIGRKFGFVHQVLSFVRTRSDSISPQHASYHVDALSRRVLLEKYGDRLLDPHTLARTRRRLAHSHYRALGEGLLLGKPERFWRLHQEGLAGAGLRISTPRVWLGALVVAARALLNLEGTLRGDWPSWH